MRKVNSIQQHFLMTRNQQEYNMRQLTEHYMVRMSYQLVLCTLLAVP